MARSLQDAARFGTKGKNMTRRNKVFGMRLRVGKNRDGTRPVKSTDTCSNTLRSIDRDSEGCLMRFAVLLNHLANPKPSQLCAGGRHADQTARITNHRIYSLWSDFRCSHNQIAFVLTTFVIGNNYQLAGSDVLYG